MIQTPHRSRLSTGRPPRPRPVRQGLRVHALLAVLLMSLPVLNGCGGSGDQAQGVLKQTFAGSHHLSSGRIALALNLTPSGSSTIHGPVQISFGGPFQTLGAGRVPESNFTLGISLLGHNGSLGVISTGTAGYVTLQGSSYQLPAATFQRLESSFAGLAGGGGGSGGLARYGINPLHWLRNPSVVGDENVNGTATTHIKAAVAVGALLSDLNTFVQRAASSGVPAAGRLGGGLSASARQQIAQEIQSPRVDVWSAKSDHTLRRLAVSMSVPVHGQISTLLGGLSSLAVSLTLNYSDVNQPQTIAAPTTLRPFSEFASKLQSLLSQVAGAAGALGLGSGAGAGTAGSTGAGAGSTGAGAGSGTSTTGAAAYGQCISQAAGDVTKMQKCASLLGGH